MKKEKLCIASLSTGTDSFAYFGFLTLTYRNLLLPSRTHRWHFCLDWGEFRCEKLGIVVSSNGRPETPPRAVGPLTHFSCCPGSFSSPRIPSSCWLAGRYHRAAPEVSQSYLYVGVGRLSIVWKTLVLVVIYRRQSLEQNLWNCFFKILELLIFFKKLCSFEHSLLWALLT